MPSYKKYRCCGTNRHPWEPSRCCRGRRGQGWDVKKTMLVHADMCGWRSLDGAGVVNRKAVIKAYRGRRPRGRRGPLRPWRRPPLREQERARWAGETERGGKWQWPVCTMLAGERRGRARAHARWGTGTAPGEQVGSETGGRSFGPCKGQQGKGSGTGGGRSIGPSLYTIPYKGQ